YLHAQRFLGGVLASFESGRGLVMIGDRDHVEVGRVLGVVDQGTRGHEAIGGQGVEVEVGAAWFVVGPLSGHAGVYGR
ncbi:MAG: hypothetical protein JOZ81_08045, partial [Chloroflexi bacterium]|nr:hypothetical protein [Chloroflexota bacterium]